MFIDLDPNELKKISIDIEGYDDALNNDYFPNALQYVSDLIANTNGIKTEEVVSILRSIYDKLIFYSDDIKSNLNGLEEQIAESLEAYNISTEDAREKLAQLFLVMQEFVNSGKIDMSSVSSDGYMTEDSGEEPTPDDASGEPTPDDASGEPTPDDASGEPTQPNVELYDDIVGYLGCENVGGEPDFAVVETHLQQRMDNLGTELDPMINEFIQDYTNYNYNNGIYISSSPDYVISSSPDHLIIQEPISSFIDSDAGAKYAKYLGYPNVGNHNYLEIIRNPHIAFSEYLHTAVNNGTCMQPGEYRDGLYNDVHDFLAYEWAARNS